MANSGVSRVAERAARAIGTGEAPYADGRGPEELQPLTLDGAPVAESDTDDEASVGQGVEPAELLDRVAPAKLTAVAPAASTPRITPRASRPKARRGEQLVKIEVWVQESVSNRMKSKSRPLHTGAGRFLGANFIAQGLLQAAWDLAGDELDMTGLDKGREDEMLVRAREALIRACQEL